jgi:hypothetical protein
MTLDSTALGIPICVDLITLAIVKGFPSGQFASSRVVNVDARGSDQTCVIVVDSKSQAPKV